MDLPEFPIHSFISLVESLPPAGIYIFLGFSVFLENVFPPWPSDVIIVFAGFLSGKGVIGLLPSLISILIGNLLGAYLMFFAGSWLVHRIQRLTARFGNRRTFFERMLLDFTDPDYLSRAEKWFGRFGFAFVFFSRFFAGVRFFVGIVAGASGMNPILYGIAFGGGALLWSSLLFLGGKTLGGNWELVLEWIKLYNYLFLIFGAGGLILVFYWKLRKEEKGKWNK